MAQAALITNVVGGVMGAAGAMSGAKAEKAQAERNAYIGRTRAIQTNASSREGLNDEMATMRATLAANGQGGGAFELMQALRRTREGERRIEVGNRNREASDWRMQGRNAMARGRAGAMSSLFSAAPSMFDLYQLRTGGTNG